ncbi:MAG: DUF4091 domain-containing protein [Ruminococcaceae bacterium]|nr:DUF4091 domain-containing protein [Oscillospiraceae bacterium]
MMEYRILTSLAKVFADECPQTTWPQRVSMLKNEIYSFQVAFLGEEHLTDVEIRAEGSLAPYMTLREVELVPSLLPAGQFHDDYILRDTPGLYPDPLVPLKPMVRIIKGLWKSIWVTVKPVDIVGEQTAVVVISHPEKGELVRAEMEINILPAVLPEQELICTMWFHVDGIASAHQVDPYSDKGFEIIGNYMKEAAAHGVNMILTPVLTPPLDTAVGGERMTVQLVDIIRDGDRYEFNFSKLRRYIAVAKESGMKYIEIAHFFSQSGAKYATKVMATDRADGKYKKIFGWEQNAVSEEYLSFLRQLVPALVEVIRECGMEKNTYFHVSDEPHVEHMEQYTKAGSALKALIPGFPVIDALSEIEFYETGAVKKPVPNTTNIQPFLDAEVPGLWTYYCCGQWEKVANRFFAMPSERNRVLGIQLYKFNIAGFLQWGYNFYNVCDSLWSIDPWRVTDAGGGFPSGDSFVVYPFGDSCVSSLRFEVFQEALQDLRALKLAEKLCGREAVLAEMEKGIAPITFFDYPHDPAWLLDLRERINRMIAAEKD